MSDQTLPAPAPVEPWWATAISNSLPELRNIASYACGVATAAGVLSLKDQTTLIDALTHIGADVADIAKYVGIIGGVTMPIWARQSAKVVNLIRSLSRKAPDVQVVAPPAIAAVTPAASSAKVAVVSKVSGQEITPAEPAKPAT